MAAEKTDRELLEVTLAKVVDLEKLLLRTREELAMRPTAEEVEAMIRRTPTPGRLPPILSFPNRWRENKPLGITTRYSQEAE